MRPHSWRAPAPAPYFIGFAGAWTILTLLSGLPSMSRPSSSRARRGLSGAWSLCGSPRHPRGGGRALPSFESLGALATLYAETGDIERALHLHGESLRRYRGVSPLPLAVLEFQIGVMWMHSGELDRARDQSERSAPLRTGIRGRRRATSPRSKQNWATSKLRSPCCGRWRCHRTIPTTLRNWHVSSLTLETPKSPSTGGISPPCATRSWKRCIPRHSPTMLPSSGLGCGRRSQEGAAAGSNELHDPQDAARRGAVVPCCRSPELT